VNQQVASGLLERAGHVPSVAANGREVLSLLENEVFDLVLMDVQMPEMDGLEATAAIRARERGTGAHLPIVALTAHAMKGDAEKCLAAGMDGYLTKPLQLHDLEDEIARVIEGRAPSRPASTPAPPALSGRVDAVRLLERVGGDTKALARIVRTFLADGPKQLARIREAVDAGDPEALRRAAHALKGAVSNFAAGPATKAALRLQGMGERQDLSAAAGAFGRLERELTVVFADLRRLAGRGESKKRPAAPIERATGNRKQSAAKKRSGVTGDRATASDERSAARKKARTSRRR
jgi:CheY-like chemotaxis protein/HPt (histidine-containing phosphotransfer) domain-containing protein